MKIKFRFLATSLFTLSVLFFGYTYAQAATTNAGTTKTYTLTKLRKAVANHEECSGFAQTLAQLQRKPLTMQFSAHSGKAKINAEDTSGQVANHTHSILKQSAAKGMIHRVVTGEFEFNGQSVEYVTDIVANLNNPNHEYLYPTILTSHDGQCAYTALIKPSDETVAAFKKNLTTGHAAKGTDIYKK